MKKILLDAQSARELGVLLRRPKRYAGEKVLLHFRRTSEVRRVAEETAQALKLNIGDAVEVDAVSWDDNDKKHEFSLYAQGYLGDQLEFRVDDSVFECWATLICGVSYEYGPETEDGDLCTIPELHSGFLITGGLKRINTDVGKFKPDFLLEDDDEEFDEDED